MGFGNTKAIENKSKTSPNSADFNQSIKMIKTDGTAGHIHSMPDFNLIASVINNKNPALSGSATISMKKGPVNNVPITTYIADQGPNESEIRSNKN
jgi:hypothetical protein